MLYYLGPTLGCLCCICKLPVGNTRRCSRSGCTFAFHVNCLWYAGGDITVSLKDHEYVSYGIQPKLIAFCPLHQQVSIDLSLHHRILLLRFFSMYIQGISIVPSQLLVDFILGPFLLGVRTGVTFVDTLPELPPHHLDLTSLITTITLQLGS